MDDDEFTEIFTIYTTTKCIDANYAHVPSDFWIETLSYGPYLKMFATIGFFLLSRYLHPKPLYLFFLSTVAFFDVFVVNNLLRNFVFDGRGAPVPGCGGQNVFPNWPVELACVMCTLIATFPILYKVRRDVFTIVICIAIVAYVTAGQIYLNYATIFQTAVAAWVGFVEGVVFQMLFYVLVCNIRRYSSNVSVFGYTLDLTKDSSLLMVRYFSKTPLVF